MLIFLTICQVRFAGSASGSRRVRVLKNGASVIAETGVGTTTGLITAPMNAAAHVPLGVGDYVVAEVFQSSGGALDLDPLSSFSLALA